MANKNSNYRTLSVVANDPNSAQ